MTYEEMKEYYRWRPISEIHEDYGQCVLFNIISGEIEIGNNLDTWFIERDWTHFSKIVPLTTEGAERLIEEMS